MCVLARVSVLSITNLPLFIRLCTCYGASGEKNICPRNPPQQHEEGRLIQHHRQVGMECGNNEYTHMNFFHAPLHIPHLDIMIIYQYSIDQYSL